MYYTIVYIVILHYYTKYGLRSWQWVNKWWKKNGLLQIQSVCGFTVNHCEGACVDKRLFIVPKKRVSHLIKHVEHPSATTIHGTMKLNMIEEQTMFPYLSFIVLKTSKCKSISLQWFSKGCCVWYSSKPAYLVLLSNSFGVLWVGKWVRVGKMYVRFIVSGQKVCDLLISYLVFLR